MNHMCRGWWSTLKHSPSGSSGRSLRSRASSTVNARRCTWWEYGAQDFEVDPSAERWLADVIDVPHEKVSPDGALDRQLDRTEGMVVWDPKVPTRAYR